MQYILGVSAFYHDAAVALLDSEGTVIFASHEERFSRLKHDPGFPILALCYLKEKYELSPDNIDAVVFYEKPISKFIRNVESVLSESPLSYPFFSGFTNSIAKAEHGFSSEIEDFLKEVWPKSGWKNKIKFSKHHLSHAASAFFNSPYKEAAILTVDGVGETQTASIMHGDGNKITELYSMEYPNSIGILYSAITAFCGMKPNSGEYKLMGLAPFGEPKYLKIMEQQLVKIDHENLEITINKKIVNPNDQPKKTLRKLSELFEASPATSDKLEIVHADIAASMQVLLNKIMEILALKAKKLTNSNNLVMAGGVALNCVSNSHVATRSNLFDAVWVFPAAGDAGCALGAAQAYYYAKNSNLPIKRKWFSPYLGRSFSSKEIKSQLDASGAIYRDYSKNKKEATKKIAAILKSNGAGGVFIGSSEFGPRALGARSIIGLASDETAQVRLNLKTKFRESYRPFAPILFETDLKKYFNLEEYCSIPLEYMLFTAPLIEKIRIEESSKNKKVKNFGERISGKRSTLPAITHVDYSARIQTIVKDYPQEIIDFFNFLKKDVGEDVFINTSFNVRGEPIVDKPSDAFSAFMRTDLNFLYIDGFFLLKSEQKATREAFDIVFEED